MLKTASTRGAHKSFREKGQLHRANIACALYRVAVDVSMDWSAAAVSGEVTVDVAAAAVAAALAMVEKRCCINKGMVALRPMGMPCSV